MVRIAKDLGSSMSHFEANQDAIVIGSYRDQYGGDDVDSYTVMLCKSGGETSWYHEHQLTLIRHVGDEGIAAVKSEREKREAVETDLEWIVKNWPSIRDKTPGATMGELMRRCGITNPWGAHGEGYTYYMNAMATHRVLDPVLQTGDIGKVTEFMDALARHSNVADQPRLADRDNPMKQ